ncbi:MAG: helix-turn-helix domain-containing protein [Defluviitaleaceae bacterium]|nr:helix-turn-helix domain-containing protein [Defluviitaleaceae bacterium]
MKENSKLALGEKIRQVREARMLSIENVAYAISSNKSSVSRLERGETGCSAENLAKIRKFLDIEKAPLLEPELDMYRDRIWVWYDLISANKLDEARSMQSDMSVILDLPYEHNLIGLYLMTEARLLYREGNMPAVDQRLKDITCYLDNASDEVLHIYHRNKGAFHNFLNKLDDLKEALRHYLLTFEYVSDNVKPDAQIYFNIGTVYHSVGKPLKGIVYLERAAIENNRDRAAIDKSIMDYYLAWQYITLGETKRPKKMLSTCIAHAKSIKNDYTLGLSLRGMGVISLKEENFDDALDFFEQAAECFEYGQGWYNVMLLDKAVCLQKMNKIDKYHELIKQIRELTKGQEEFNFRIDITEHLRTISDSNSANYLETVAIPRLMAEQGANKLVALDICRDLEASYKKKRAKAKAMAIAVVARDIYEDLFIGDIEFE